MRLGQECQVRVTLLQAARPFVSRCFLREDLGVGFGVFGPGQQVRPVVAVLGQGQRALLDVGHPAAAGVVKAAGGQILVGQRRPARQRGRGAPQRVQFPDRVPGSYPLQGKVVTSRWCAVRRTA